MYKNSVDFGSSLENLIIQLQFNINELYPIFQEAFEAAYGKFAAHIPNHPTRQLFFACQVFDPKFIQTKNVLQKNIQQYNAIKEFINPIDELLREWKIYCKLNNEFLDEMELDQYWINKTTSAKKTPYIEDVECMRYLSHSTYAYTFSQQLILVL